MSVGRSVGWSVSLDFLARREYTLGSTCSSVDEYVDDLFLHCSMVRHQYPGKQELKFWCVETGSKSSIFNKLKILIVGIDKKKTQCKIVGRLICQQLPISKPKELRNIMVKFRVQSDEGEAKSHQNKHKGF